MEPILTFLFGVPPSGGFFATLIKTMTYLADHLGRSESPLDQQNSATAMRSVPLRGSGWSRDCRLSTADFRLMFRLRPIGNRQLTIGNHETHPLPRGGTDLIPPLVS